MTTSQTTIKLPHQKFSQKLLAAFQKGISGKEYSDEVLEIFHAALARVQGKGTRRAKTSYQYYTLDEEVRKAADAAIREELKNDGNTVPETIPYRQLVAKMSLMWKETTPEERQPYEEMSEEEKKKMPPQEPAPRKRARSAYHFWMASDGVRDKMKSLYPDTPAKEMLSKYGEVWKGMSDEEKAPFNEMAEQESTKAPKKATGSYRAYISDPSVKEKINKKIEDEGLDKKDYISIASQQWNALTDEEKAPWQKAETSTKPIRKRARTAYQLWKDAEETRQYFAKEFPDKKYKDLTDEIKARWKELGLEEQQSFHKQAEMEKHTLSLLQPQQTTSLTRSTSGGMATENLKLAAKMKMMQMK